MAAKEEHQGALALVLDLAKALERVSLLVVWAWATHCSSPREILRVLCGYYEHQRRVQFEGCVAEPLQTITATLSGGLKLPVTGRLDRKNREVAEMAKKVMKKLKKRGEEERTQIASDRGWKGRKEQDDCIVWFLGGRDASMQQGRRSDDGRQCGNASSRLEKQI